MNLQKKHLEAIKDKIWIEGEIEASEDCAQITKDYMKRFAEWIISDGYILQDNGRLFKETQLDLSKDYSFDELIEIFLQTENK